ncbi:hypothetical protein [Streptomyces sp. NBC_00134]
METLPPLIAEQRAAASCGRPQPVDPAPANPVRLAPLRSLDRGIHSQE